MGVPALFRWLSQKYPKIISPVIEEKAQAVDGEEIPVDYNGPNPNGEEMDNLYLDMNGIVHPCSHPEDKPAPETEEDMMLEIFKYTDRVVNMVRPRKLLMIAVDGVAPRAKMNQQRSRRFRSAQEAKEKDEEKEEFARLLRAQGKGPEEEVKPRKTWDSNSITPGTPFMNTLALSLRYWCSYKLNEDPSWKGRKVIISDATVPGEGEHKIMEFIRSQRSSPEHDANTRHVMYGLDADLIMLGLATHEPHFRILREDVFFQESKARVCKLCGQAGHKMEECTGEAKVKQGEFDEKQHAIEKPFIWLHVSILREYLNEEMYVPNAGFEFDLERALDDWVFMCFFVGNDFLPHLPSLDIRDQGIDTLIAIWRDNLPMMRGYVTKDGFVDLERAQVILEGLAKQEDAIFKRRREAEERREAGNRRRQMEAERRKSQNNGNYNGSNDVDSPSRPPKRQRGELAPDVNALPTFSPADAGSWGVRQATSDAALNRGAVFKANEANKSAAAVLKERMKNGDSSLNGNPEVDSPSDQSMPASGKRKRELMEDDTASKSSPATPDSTDSKKAKDDELPPDTVRLWEEGYADRYYEQKFHVDPSNKEFRHEVARHYVTGLAWVLLYYFQGCASWTWYYPYHYAPFAADCKDLAKIDINFDKGKPFRPYEQLMGVMPAASKHTIPEVFHSLMTDEDSDIIDFYPEDFPLDLNGKKFAWQGVVILPFIDEKRLLAAMATRYPDLSSEEVARNEVGKAALLFSTSHDLYEDVAMKLYSKKQGAPVHPLDPSKSNKLLGMIEKNESYIPNSSLAYPFASGQMPTLEEDLSIAVHYHLPETDSKASHKSMLLPDVKLPPPTLTAEDKAATRERASNSGRNFGGAPLRRGSGRGRGRGGDRINYGRDSYNGDSRNGNGYQDSYPSRNSGSNPFAAHLDPNFINAAAARGFPPPQNMPPGFVPPPPQFGRGGPPPPPQYGGWQGQGQGPPSAIRAVAVTTMALEDVMRDMVEVIMEVMAEVAREVAKGAAREAVEVIVGDMEEGGEAAVAAAATHTERLDWTHTKAMAAIAIITATAITEEDRERLRWTEPRLSRLLEKEFRGLDFEVFALLTEAHQPNDLLYNMEE
ncbi:MAG: 5'-3' exoribonuclease 2 [Bogoriella megaspora]|nr:MAG: 5'-3' exoribonuclease 2 [Bogoriella megaspora]